MSFPARRPRRLRTTPAMRRLTAELTLAPQQLILPAFVREGLTEPNPITSMPGVVQHTLDTLKAAAAEAVELGLGGIMLFGIPETRDAVGSAGIDPDGILNRGIEAVRAEVGDELVIMSDLCLDEFTDHGHCGVLDAKGNVDNDATLEIYGRHGRRAGGGRRPHARPLGHDGRPGRRRPRGPRRGRPPGRLHPRLRRQVRLRVLRPVPRGRRLPAEGRPPHLPDGCRPTAARRCARSSSTSPRAPTWSWSSRP